MKSPLRFMTLGAVLAAPGLFAADNPFEGKVSLALTGGQGGSHTMNYAMKGSALRVDIAGAPVSSIIDFGRHEMTILMHEQRMYMTRPLPPAPAAEASPGPGRPADITATGKAEKILGYLCNQFLVKDGDNTTEIWLAEGLGTFAGLGGDPLAGGGGRGRRGGGATAQKWEQALKGKAGFPLRVITHDPAGKETFRLEATKVEKGGVSDADFTPPADYRKFPMPDLGGLNPFKQG